MKSLFTEKIQKKDYKLVCHDLYSAETELEVIDVLQSYTIPSLQHINN